MTYSQWSTSKNNRELLNRLCVLEKFIELKSNECAYYRSKVHLMQMNSIHTHTMKTSLVKRDCVRRQRSLSNMSHDEYSSSSTSHRCRSPSVKSTTGKVEQKTMNMHHISSTSLPFDRTKPSLVSSSIRSYRHNSVHKVNSNYAQNQNYGDYVHDRRRSSKSSMFNSCDRNNLDQCIVSHASKHIQTA
jgi:hypothetical protein